MVDRQDIDALLIGSLYGELSSAEEARLATHLESHPADRTALADLTRAREVVRESRILQIQFDPPQSVSALLMQEAHRRAPKPREEQSWFQRFMRSFMMHPAMAAAAMLVLIVGVAGTMYIRKGDHFAKQTANEPAMPSMTAGKESAPVTSPADDGGEVFGDAGAVAANADDYQVRLRDELDGNVEQKKQEAKDRVVDTKSGRDDSKLEKEKADKNELSFKGDLAKADPKPEPQKPAKVATSPKAKKPAPNRGYLEVTTPDQAPKDFGGESTKTSTVARSEQQADESRTGAGGAAGAKAPGASDSVAKPTDPRVASQPPAPPPPAPATPPAEKAAENKPSPELAWAKEQHAKVSAQVKAGKCNEAAAIAVQIANRNPTYFAQQVETDRTIKPCLSYITAQRERDAERVQRSKATQKRSVDEPAKAAPTSTK